MQPAQSYAEQSGPCLSGEGWYTTVSEIELEFECSQDTMRSMSMVWGRWLVLDGQRRCCQT